MKESQMLFTTYVQEYSGEEHLHRSQKAINEHVWKITCVYFYIVLQENLVVSDVS